MGVAVLRVWRAHLVVVMVSKEEGSKSHQDVGFASGRRIMFRKTLVPWIALVSVSCASTGAPESTMEDDVSEGLVEMIVINRTTGAVTVYVQWRPGGRVALGEVSGRQTRTFMTPYRGSEFRLSLNVLSSPPPLTRPPLAGAPTRPREPFVTVRPGDRYEWEIQQTVPSVRLFYRRLRPG